MKLMKIAIVAIVGLGVTVIETPSYAATANKKRDAPTAQKNIYDRTPVGNMQCSRRYMERYGTDGCKRK